MASTLFLTAFTPDFAASTPLAAAPIASIGAVYGATATSMAVPKAFTPLSTTPPAVSRTLS